MPRGKTPPNPSWQEAATLVGERALERAAAASAEPRQTRYDWRQHGVPWYQLGPIIQEERERDLRRLSDTRPLEGAPDMNSADTIRLLAFLQHLKATQRETYEAALALIRTLPTPSEPDRATVLQLVRQPPRNR